MSTRGLIFIAGIIVGFFVGMLSFSSHGAGKLYGNCVHTCDNKTSKYNIEQQKRRGERDTPKYTTCRLKTQRKARTGKMLCVYEGANKTYETQIGDVSGGCPSSYECIYNPGSKMINIDDVLRSLNNAVKD